MNCQKCNNTVTTEAKFCGTCGSSIDSSLLGSIIAADVSTDIETQQLPMVNFPEAIKRGFNNYLVFRGRATRAELWWWALFSIVGGIITSIIDQFSGLPGILNAIFGLATLIPSISVAFRRFHDINKTGWWQFLWLIPIVVAVIISLLAWGAGLDGRSFYGTVIGIFIVLTLITIVLLIYFLVKQGDKGPNKYGPDPRQSVEVVD